MFKKLFVAIIAQSVLTVASNESAIAGIRHDNTEIAFYGRSAPLTFQLCFSEFTTSQVIRSNTTAEESAVLKVASLPNAMEQVRSLIQQSSDLSELQGNTDRHGLPLTDDLTTSSISKIHSRREE